MTTRRSFDEGNARQGVPDSFLRSDPLFGEGCRLSAEEIKPVERNGEAMTSDGEVKAAAEYIPPIKRGSQAGLRRNMCITSSIDVWDLVTLLEQHHKTLSDWVLARLAADEQREREDAEPITEEWAVQNGGGRCDDGGIAWKIWERGQDESTEEPAFHVLWSQGSLWLECYSATGDTLGIIELMAPPTRGGLRRLLEAMKGGA